MLTEYLQQKWLLSQVLFISMRRKILHRLLKKHWNWVVTKKIRSHRHQRRYESTTGFGHAAILSHADTVIEAVKSGAIRHFFLVAGCDGAKPDETIIQNL